MEGDRKKEGLLMRNSSLFHSTAGKFQRGTDNTECRNPARTHPDNFSARFSKRLASGSSSSALPPDAEDVIISTTRRQSFLPPRFVLRVFSAALADTVVDEITRVSL